MRKKLRDFRIGVQLNEEVEIVLLDPPRGESPGFDPGGTPRKGHRRGSGTSAFRGVWVLAAGAQAIQILVAAMRALDDDELVVSLGRGRFASGGRGRDGDDEAARPVLAEPARVGVARSHLTRCCDLNVAHGGRCRRLARGSSNALGGTFD